MFTLSKIIKVNGIGIHSGQTVEMSVLPSLSQGISFEYQNSIVLVDTKNLSINHIRSTSITNGTVTINTPEHFLSACYALRLTNILVKLSSSELPILDGSAIDFIKYLKPNRKIIEYEAPVFQFSKFQEFDLNGSKYSVIPSDKFIIDATVSYPKHWLKNVSFYYEHSLESYLSDISSARTYGFLEEVEALQRQGLAKGGSLENALVISDTGYVNFPRYHDEIARHKILDFIGDMAIAGRQWLGHFKLYKPSHQGNLSFLKFLLNHDV